ncbi:NUDIX hydrolase [Chloroflexota bacterium]
MKRRLKELLARRQKRHIDSADRRPAAVLIPIYYKEGQYYILFTKRTDKVRVHKGEISFPGGAYEEEDGSLLNTALRESAEEVGLVAGDIEVLGELDDTLTQTSDYVVSPFVACIPWPYQFKVDGEEIEQLIEVPVAMLLDRSCLRQETRTEDDKIITSFFYHCYGHVIWGATARVLNQLLDVIVRATGAAGR